MVRICGMVLLSVCVPVLSGTAAWADEKTGTLTAADRTEIQQLVAAYATALGTCAAEDYAKLFEPDGTFASGPRGTVRGREPLMALVQSERHCNGAGERKPFPTPTVEIQPTAGGAAGQAPLGSDGTYIDDYAKTPNGWRFKLRQVITGQEKAAGLAGQDFVAIRQLAGEGNMDYGDLWITTPDGLRFRSSGIVVAANQSGITGRIHLKSGGRYDDVYAKTSAGWRFQSRTFVPEIGTGANGAAQQVR